MARTVYPSDMVCHLWANHHNVNVRTSSGNLYTENGVLFSYGSHFAIAAFLITPQSGPALILWNDASTSNTTNRHRSQAFRALSSNQRSSIVSVPVLDAQMLRNIPRLAAACIDEAKKPLEQCAKARQALAHHYENAARLFRSAVSLFTYAGDLKAVQTVPVLPAFDENNPKAMKAAAADVLAAIARADILASARQSLERARGDVNAAEIREHLYKSGGMPATFKHGARFAHGSAFSICQAANDAEKNAEKALSCFKKAATNPPPELFRIKKKAATIKNQYTAAAHAELLIERRASVQSAKRQALAVLADYQRGERVRTLSTGKRIPIGSIPSVLWRFERFDNDAPMPNEYAELWPNEKERAANAADWQAIRARVKRVEAAAYVAQSAQELQTAIDNYTQALSDNGTAAARYGAGLPDSRYLSGQLAKWHAIAGTVPEYWRIRAAALINKADLLRLEHAERIAKENAERVERWRNGERVSVPRELPPMVRIVGQTVETSWGASVPLEHAARLIRIAQRVAANGGADYCQGDGPIVGHFRVNRIGADLSAVIGCHTFTADESRRAVQLIEAATIAETSEH